MRLVLVFLAIALLAYGAGWSVPTATRYAMMSAAAYCDDALENWSCYYCVKSGMTGFQPVVFVGIFDALLGYVGYYNDTSKITSPHLC